MFDKLKGRVLVKPEDQLELTEQVSFNRKIVKLTFNFIFNDYIRN
jgi:hypothetical protein